MLRPYLTCGCFAVVIAVQGCGARFDASSRPAEEPNGSPGQFKYSLPADMSVAPQETTSAPAVAGQSAMPPTPATPTPTTSMSVVPAAPTPAATAQTATATLSPASASPAPADPAQPNSPRFTATPVDPLAETSPDQGIGPGLGGDKYARLEEEGFLAVRQQPLSTFSIDVDTASYSKARMYLLQRNTLPPPDAVRIEEWINYFDYSYAPPSGPEPFATHIEVASCPWNSRHLLARVGIKGREIHADRPASNLVFLLDVSGSMNSPHKLGLVQQSMRLLANQLNAQDHVAIVVYAGAAGLVLPATEGDRRAEILGAIDQLRAGGSTNGGAGIQLAYQVARQHWLPNGTNRVILCTDGDFNVGVTSTGELVRLAEAEAQGGIFLTVLGFGMGNHNDAMLEELSGKANGTYAFVDSEAEARKIFVDQIDSTLVTIAKDVKIQIEFNPAEVQGYRLLGYDDRRLAAHEFNDDRKDAGDVGAGHSVTALYELVPQGGGSSQPLGSVDPLRYQGSATPPAPQPAHELMLVKLRYKLPDSSTSQLLTWTVPAGHRSFGGASADFRFAAGVAEFGLLLRRSDYHGDAGLDAVQEIATASLGHDQHGYRREFLEMVRSAGRLTGVALPDTSTSGGIFPAQRPTISMAAPYVFHSAPQPGVEFWGVFAVVGLVYLFLSTAAVLAVCLAVASLTARAARVGSGGRNWGDVKLGK